MSLREAMDRLLEQSIINPRGGSSARAGLTLPLDLWETTDSLLVRVPLPGVKPEQVDIDVHGSTLTIRATLPGAADEDTAGDGDGSRVRWITRELPRGEARRTVELPIAVDADGATARFADGLLLLTLPKAQTARPRRITVTPG